METLGSKIVVEFSETHNKEFQVGGITLIRPDMWLSGEDDYGNSSFESNVNKLNVHPQIVTVIVGNDRYAEGKTYFVHYLSKEWEEKTLIGDKEYSLIECGYVLFEIVGDEYIMEPETFLGTRIFETETTLSSGIILGFENKNQECKIKITHIPQERIEEVKSIEIGDTVITIDDNQYEISVNGKDKIVKLTSDEIVAIWQKANMTI